MFSRDSFSMNRKNLIIAAYFFIFTAAAGAEQPGISDIHLMPTPAVIEQTPGKFRIAADFGVLITGADDTRLATAVSRMLERMERETGFFLKEAPGGKPVFQIHCAAAGEAFHSLSTDESYELEITPGGARLAANEPAGILRGLETFLGLIDIDDESFFLPGVKISDYPRFRWRGINIDVSRHWQPAEFIMRTLDAMAAVKMNVLHWHLSDDQGFRVESLIYPRLHGIASGGDYYTQAQIREIIAYARDRGIRVVPEFDMPGHATALLTAYPEFASAKMDYKIEKSIGVFDPSLNPADEKVYEFLDAFIGEMSGLFPDEYFHIGGDEVTARHWNANPGIQKFKTQNNLKTNQDLQAYFNRRVAEILRRHGKKMIGWGEALHENLPKDTVVQAWQSKPTIPDILRRGFPAILSRGFYLDHMRPASFHYEIDPFGGEFSKLSEEERSRLLGGEACMWAEFADKYNIESRIWPRAAVIAERLWSPAEAGDTAGMYRRLEYIEKEFRVQGLIGTDDSWKLLRMTPDANSDSFHILTELLKPVILSERQRARKYLTDTPLNRLADVLPPESRSARRFEDMVNRALSAPSISKDDIAGMRETLTRWQTGVRNAIPALRRSFLLKEMIPVAETIDETIALALDALRFIETGSKASAEQREKAKVLLEKAGKIQAETEIVIVSAINKLWVICN
jgi:hexosaminidase